MVHSAWVQNIAIIQGAYYFVTGLWPLFHISSFVEITGPKTDLWLVKTAGTLITAIGATLLFAAQDTPDTSIIILGLLSALGLANIDIVYARRGTISKIYLWDAAAEVGLAVSWLLSFQ